MAAKKNSPSQLADALLKLSEAADAVAETERDMLALRSLLHDQPNLLGFMRDPAVQGKGKRAALEELLENRIGPLTMGFLGMLVHMHAFEDLDHIADMFFVKSAESEKKTSGRIVSAVPLPDETVARVEEAIGQAIGRGVHLLAQVDPQLLGGIKVTVGDYIMDGTIETYLSEARIALLSQPETPGFRCVSSRPLPTSILVPSAD